MNDEHKPWESPVERRYREDTIYRLRCKWVENTNETWFGIYGLILLGLFVAYAAMR